jgi:V/A-type H+-transporting ATPase subunit B
MKEYRSVTRIEGPLLFVERTDPVGYGELVTVRTRDGIRRGQVLDTSERHVVVQVFEGTSGIDRSATVKFLGDAVTLGVTEDMLGRVLSGAGKPVDGGPEPIPERRVDILGSTINPFSRKQPFEFIQTGISTIDATNSLLRGQKLPLFSGAGLPHNELALQIARQANTIASSAGTADSAGRFVIVFAAMGITNEEAQRFMQDFEETGALDRAVVFLNLANDPVIERLLTPRMALTAAEYLAFERNMHVLVILTDMTNYCESLREIASARQEIPGRRGYPGYMYTDLSTIYERAGIIKGKKGSVTQIPILTLPSDDLTHPVPDLTGYITEGQIVISRELHRKGIYPPIDILPSLSRLMNLGIGDGKTRDDHKAVAEQIYALYAEGRDLRGLVAIVGEEALGERERAILAFAAAFEQTFVGQRLDEKRSIVETLDRAWKLFELVPEKELTKLPQKLHDANRARKNANEGAR